MIDNIVNYLNTYDFKHFVKIISKIEVNYYKYLKCILKKDLFKISDDLLIEVKNYDKETIIKILGKHFSNKSYNYFLSKINNIENDINYKKFLKCMSTKNITSIYGIINSKKYMKKYLETILNLPFDSKRKIQDLNYITNAILVTSNNNNDTIVNYIFNLTKLYKGEIINVENINIEIVSELYKSGYSILYVGRILNLNNGEQKEVVVKLQPIFPYNIKEYEKYYDYQIPYEKDIMNKIKNFCYNSITLKILGYGIIKKMQKGDIDRHVLVTEKLGKDLHHISVNNYPISFIKNICIKILKALQTIHSCDLINGYSYIHCDIKPKNIVFIDDIETSIKIIDFGFAINIMTDKKRDLTITALGGTSLFMSISQYEDNPCDYMDDLQAVGWMLLYFFGFNLKNKSDIIIYEFKKSFVNNYTNKDFIKNLTGKYLTEHNINVIGKFCDYTIKRGDKKNKYTTDKKINNIYYCDYNEQYYKDLEDILNLLK